MVGCGDRVNPLFALQAFRALCALDLQPGAGTGVAPHAPTCQCLQDSMAPLTQPYHDLEEENESRATQVGEQVFLLSSQ